MERQHPLVVHAVDLHRFLPYVDPAHPDFLKRWLRVARWGVAGAVLVVVVGALVGAQTPFGRFMRAFVDIAYLHRYAQAERSMRELIADNPGDRFAPYAMLSSAIEYQGRYTEALTVLDEAVLLFPDDPRPHAKRCAYGATAGVPGAVLDSCDRAVELRPLLAENYSNRGLARALSGDLAGARTDLEHYVDTCTAGGGSEDPDCVQGTHWLADVNAGRVPPVPELTGER